MNCIKEERVGHKKEILWIKAHKTKNQEDIFPIFKCAGCHSYRPWGAFLIGFTSGVTYLGISSALKGMKIDDPLDIVAVHLGGGLGQIAILLKTQIQIMH